MDLYFFHMHLLLCSFWGLLVFSRFIWFSKNLIFSCIVLHISLSLVVLDYVPVLVCLPHYMAYYYLYLPLFTTIWIIFVFLSHNYLASLSISYTTITLLAFWFLVDYHLFADNLPSSAPHYYYINYVRNSFNYAFSMA